METSGCQFRVLSTGPIGRVDHCPHCNTLNIHMSFITLRLPVQAATMVHALLGQAIQAMPRSPEVKTPLAEALA